MSQVTDDKNKQQQKSLQPYQSPHLLIFGALRDLTAAGTGTSPESTPNPKKPPKDPPPPGQLRKQRP